MSGTAASVPAMRRRWNPSLTVLLALALAVIVAACGSNSRNDAFPGSDGGAGSSSGGSGSSSGTPGDGGFGTFGDATTKGHDSGSTVPPLGCDSSCPAAGGQCINNVCQIVDNAGQIDPGTQGSLQGGGSADSTFKWIYPYDQTVFPRGLLPPTLQFNGTAADAVYVHITAASLDYKGYYKPSASGGVSFALSGPSWTAVVEAAGSLPDKLTVAVTKSSGGQVTGPITETWPVAQGSLRGNIYYETYGSQLAGGVGSVAIMQINPGATQPVVLKSGCGNVCHTASADGSTLVAAQGLFAAPSASYDLKNNAAQIYASQDVHFVYGGLYPDGSFLMSATNYRLWLAGNSALYSTTSGANISAPGWDNVIKLAGVPAFSPDGKQLVFVHEDKDQGHSIAKMDFAKGTYTFSNLTDLATDSGMVAWPAYTPDGKRVVYGVQTSPGSCPGSNGGTSSAPPFETDCNSGGDLSIVDVASHTAQRLSALDGYTGSGTPSYLPAGDPNLNFAPTVLPEAVGGYFWVVFTSHRAYGNLIPSKAGSSSGNDDRGQLWVAAIDLNATAGQDPSHPAFYLDGQEATANNLRGFWVLPPCKQNGQSCTTGDECCNGFCRPAGDGGPLECVPPPAGCSNDYEKCTTAADCCNTIDECINGFCAQPSAQ